MPMNTDASLARRTVRARAAGLSALLLGGLFIGFLLLVIVFLEYRRAIDWVDHTHEVISTVESLQSTLYDTESGQRGYLLLADPAHLAAYEEGRDRSRLLLDSIGSLTADNPVQQDMLKALRSLTADRLHQIAEVLRQATEAGLEQALATIREGKGASTMAEIRRLTATMRAEEDMLLARRSRHATILELLMIAYGIIFVTVIGWLGYSTVRRLERDYQAERAEGEALSAALQENRILLDEVNHRVKNSLQIVANLLRTQAMRHRSQEVREELLDSSSRVLAIAEVHRRLYGEGAVYDTVELSDLIRSIAENAIPPTGSGEPAMTMAVQSPLPASVDTAVPVALIVNELLTNSYKHAFPDGRHGTVKLDMEVAGNEVRIDVADDGIGLPEEVASGGGGGFGLNTVRNLTRQLRGHLEIERLTPGTRFLLTFPMKPGAPTQA
ncbi:two-component sensor histidine kinase/CHASE3 domain sensor protein [Azospirillum lipoferum]|uniref:histidine kinase n=1 Tax=Azospirillum lipoferum TaxID=193 RepID=A0A5A9GI07_AZOLI|nr:MULTISPECIES: CHASE3 domain-containing protein [Azospirillum]KAA0594060.1 two-component sensor histidine kinase [Azospirillum lipoferum]MCP1612548.1 two-component sensor histidine kinase/CHASE3 domain sensor protein [Azospirillum lipoferum]MDW5531669.1 CHASE3 domain-containing protein [Azospirillum sp. NL1]